MPWIKKGVIFDTNKEHWWNKTHTQIPTVELLEEGVFRVYYSSRDEKNRSHTSYFDVSAENPSELLYAHQEEILPLGDLGTFDDCGVMPTSILNYKQKKYLYYLGYNVRNTIPYHDSIGVAISEDNGATFKKAFVGPVIERSHHEGFISASAYALYEEDKKKFRIWYLSGTGFTTINGHAEPLYCIRYRESEDGMYWKPFEKPAIPCQNEHECIARPSVLKEDGIYKMWYSYRDTENYRTDPTKSYSIGYAESKDGIDWVRMDDKAGIVQSETGWDSEMIAYPYVIKYGDKKYMFYNGNGFGQTGIGYAVFEEEH